MGAGQERHSEGVLSNRSLAESSHINGEIKNELQDILSELEEAPDKGFVPEAHPDSRVVLVSLQWYEEAGTKIFPRFKVVMEEQEQYVERREGNEILPRPEVAAEE
ncbi:hypothetical protein VTL71DRAFT_9455 [Oculimacula yallundae]|uniref:Uncharacterized protein n=1 Tax=Oculimacula yallundae TaxID=86028 RepID=A0ABR4BRZ1_9HELO